MRLWSIHPEYLDARGLVALWREALLAQKVLLGKTKGYKNHPQLIRFRKTNHPSAAIAQYLKSVLHEADRRGYNFDSTKIAGAEFVQKIPVTAGQLQYEFKHLLRKLQKRAPDLYLTLNNVKKIKLHDIFVRVDGGVEDWERVNG